MTVHQFAARLRDRTTHWALTGEQARAQLVWHHVGTPLDYSDADEAFVGDGIAPGKYWLLVRETTGTRYQYFVQVSRAPSRITLWSGRPLEPRRSPGPAAGAPLLLGLVPKPSVAASAGALVRLDAAVSALGLRRVRGWSDGEGRGRNLGVFEIPPALGLPETEASHAGKILARVIAEEGVLAAGPLVGGVSAGHVWSQRVYLRMATGVSLRETCVIVESEELSEVRQLPIGEDVFLASVAPERAYELAEIAARLEGLGRVRHAEPVPVTEAEEDGAVAPPDLLWDRALVGIETALQLAEPKRVATLAVVDRNWHSLRTLSRHPELGAAADIGDARVIESIRFDGENEGAVVLGDDGEEDLQNTHALMCAAIAAGRISGVARRSRVLVFEDPHDDWLHVRAWRRAAGLGTRLLTLGSLAEGADVFSASIGRPEGVTEVGNTGLRTLVVSGRKGRGCVLFFSAGNGGQNVLQDRSYAALQFTLAVSASIHDPLAGERFALESGWGEDIDLCAPTGAKTRIGDSGGPYDGVLAATRVGSGPFTFDVQVRTTTVGAVVVEDPYAMVPVASVEGFALGSQVLLRAADGQWALLEIYRTSERELSLSLGEGVDFERFGPGTSVASSTLALGCLRAAVPAGGERLELDAPLLRELKPGVRVLVGISGNGTALEYTVRASDGTTLEVEETLAAHGEGDYVFFDASNWHLGRGGTSTATPLCAGTAALMLEANPRLTWVEVRHLLYESAVKIDPGCDEDKGAWVDRDGRPFSQRYGYGRLNAAEAVRLARDYKFPRDLMIRQFEGDDGGPRHLPLGSSPDIWVRSQDSRLLPDAELEDAGLHEPAVRTRPSWVFGRVRNRGTVESLEAWVRVYVAAGQDHPYRFPEDFEDLRAEILDDGIWKRGTRFLGEEPIVKVPPGGTQVVVVPWSEELMPPAVDSESRPWNPHLLLAISPLDGRDEGVTVVDCNNLAQRLIDILDP